MQGFDDIDDDGATEVVGARPRRKIVRPAEMAAIASVRPGGRISGSPPGARRDAVVLRKADQPALRLTLSHLPIFKAVWSAWSALRVQGADDPGVAVKDIQAYLEQTGQSALCGSVPGAVRGLVKGGALRTTDQHVGFQVRRTRYYPTDVGVQAFALAETLGAGASVQVGGTAAAWANRAADAPMTLFEYAALLKGGGALPETA
ncbi:middle transcription regulatory protein [Brevundimonas phage vB_BpoS-Papperlapapp]|uniref:Middle transcription regulatory protein n=2 Tax=Marchewkavirus TaxID=3425052 RepID=A0A9E7MPY5_9CAUD|nr:middle transcription regulatory protein [Brevundimonas phage vB_BpoS-Kabachok]USN14853.1 putative middle transcription regulatory protein [Brevundimonas phage vB_BpoS-Domovoi]USN16225.1 middle transcription regulatory protein [Brevundimonas phage vB_BpoS-Papperlapapp]